MKRQRLLRAARRRIRRTGQEVADGIGISEGRYFRIETGRVAIRPEEAAKLADYFGFKVEVLFPDFFLPTERGIV